LLAERAAAALIGQKREIDVTGTIGDGKFAAILPETDERGALMFAERWRTAAVTTFGRNETSPIVIFGVASFGRHGRSAEALLAAAGRALQAAETLEGNDSLLDGDEVAAAIASTDRDSASDSQLEIALALAETADARDRGVAGHSRGVGRYASLIAKELGFPDERAERIRLAGVLHDVGKLGVSRSVLQKPGPLSDVEWQIVHEHSEIGARLLDGSELADLSTWVLHHHERPDGRGYPHGLTSKEIPLESRIVGVADAYEAMTSDRAHKAAISAEEARVELIEHAGTQFDRRVVEALLRLLERQGFGVEPPTGPRAFS
jgi:HD-GYP domain-containing protein (c-di-GMP phosphodiesterase class II)